MVFADTLVFSALSSSLPSVVRIRTRPFLFLCGHRNAGDTHINRDCRVDIDGYAAVEEH